MGEKPIKRKVTKVVNYFVEQLQEHGVKVSKIVVFGSHIKGSTTKDSDIDLIVVSESFRRKNLYNRAYMIARAYNATIKEFMIPIDVIMETPEEFNPDFGVVVYAA